jgi:hypothetical protein
MKVFLIEVRKAGARSTRMKFSNPTNALLLPMESTMNRLLIAVLMNG